MGPSPRLVSLVLGAKTAGPVNCRAERALGRAFQYAESGRSALNLAGPFLHREVVRSIPVKRLAVQHERPKQKSRLGNPRGFRSSPRRGLATTKYSKISQETVGGWLTRVGAPFCSALP